MTLKGLEPGYPIPWGDGQGEEAWAPFLFASGSIPGSAEWVPIPRWQDQSARGSCSLGSVCRVGTGMGDRFLAA